MFYIPQDDARSRKARDAWKSESDPVRRMMRRQSPYSTTWAEEHDSEVLAKQRDDAELDADTTGPNEAKGASPDEVSRLEQSRAKGQRFRTDAQPRTTRISTEIESDGDDEF